MIGAYTHLIAFGVLSCVSSYGCSVKFKTVRGQRFLHSGSIAGAFLILRAAEQRGLSVRYDGPKIFWASTNSRELGQRLERILSEECCSRAVSASWHACRVPHRCWLRGLSTRVHAAVHWQNITPPAIAIPSLSLPSTDRRRYLSTDAFVRLHLGAYDLLIRSEPLG